MAGNAMLLAHYGAGCPSARTVLAAIEEEARAALPGWEVRAAWTSAAFLRRAREAGEGIPGVLEALSALQAEGYDRVSIQPTLLHPGKGYAAVSAAAADFAGEFAALKLGRPLLADEEDRVTLCRLLDREFPRGEDEVLILAGHAAGDGAFYAEVNALCAKLGLPRMLAGALPDLDAVCGALRTLAVQRVTLLPLLLTAGSHTARDIAGEAPESWRTRLTAEGYEVRAVPQGLAELPGFRARIAAAARETALRLG